MTKKVECEFFLSMNEEGDWEINTDAGDAATALVENALGGVCIRTVKITVKMTPPEVTEAEVDVADEAGETSNLDVEVT
jgi:hypothetical protein